MSKNLWSFRLIAGGLALLALAGGAAWAQPPALIQFQGRLTTSSGAPLTGSQTVFFSLWQGGTATTANSGTQFYSEQGVVTPDADGVFEFQVGSGTSTTGAIDPNKFNTASPVYLQLAVGSSGNVLLPRTRLTSVGYAMMAGVASFATKAGGLTGITSVTDVTGGRLVIGDLVRIQGTNLDSARVLVSGRAAPIKSQSASEIIFQIPALTPEGLDPVTLVQGNGTGAPLAETTVDVHRLILVIAPTSHVLFVVDERDGTILATLTLSFNFSTTLYPLQIGFGSQGALALIPSSVNGTIMALDLTKNPPAIVENYNPGLTNTIAVSVSPDNRVVVASDVANNRVMAISMQEQMPPFDGNLFVSNDLTYNLLLPQPPGSTIHNPRGSAFVGDQLLLVCFESGQVVGYRRDPTQFNPAQPTNPTNFQNEFIDKALNVEDQPTITSVGQSPLLIQPLPDRTRALVLTRDQANLQLYFLNSKGLTAPGLVTPGKAVAGSTVQNIAYSASDNIVMAVNQGTTSDDPTMRDQIFSFFVNGGSIQLIGSLEGFLHNPYPTKDLVTLGMDPVDGHVVAMTTNFATLILTHRVGTVLSYFTHSRLGNPLDKTFDQEITLFGNTNHRESLPFMAFQP